MKVQWLLILCIVSYKNAYSQEVDPRAYANLPKDMNVVVAAYAYAKGHILTDPSLPVENFNITTNNIAIGYLHTFAVAKKLARVSFAIPFTAMSGRLKFNGDDTSGTRTGFGDMRIRLGINLIGSSALSIKEFNKYSQKTIIGISLITSIPTGQYYDDKLVNIGSNRWGFKPEIGASKRFKRFYTDGYIGAWLFTNNTHYQVNKVLKQDPVFSFQLHGSYYFKNRMWVGLNSTWFNGGKTYIDDAAYGNLLDHWRLGATWSVSFAKKHVVKLQYHMSVYAKAGSNYKLLALSYQYTFF